MIDSQEPDSGFTNAELEEIWAMFGQEGGEALDTVEETLLALETNPADSARIAELFRAMHTFKGMARMMGLVTIESLAHRAEDLVGLVRDDGVTLTGNMIDLLLEVLDQSRDLLSFALNQRQDAAGSVTEKLVARLQASFAQYSPAKPPAPAALDAAETPAEPLQPIQPTVDDLDSDLPAPPAAEQDAGAVEPAAINDDEPDAASASETSDSPPAVEIIDPATDSFYVQIFRELAQQDYGRLRHALNRGDESVLEEMRAAADSLGHAAGQMGYRPIEAVLANLRHAIEEMQGEASLDRLAADVAQLEMLLVELFGPDFVTGAGEPSEPAGLEPLIDQTEAALSPHSENRSLQTDRGIFDAPNLEDVNGEKDITEQPGAPRQDTAVESAINTDNNALTEFMQIIGEALTAQSTLHRISGRLAEMDLIQVVTQIVKKSGGNLDHARQEIQRSLNPWVEDLQVLGQTENDLSTYLSRLHETALLLREKPAAQILQPLDQWVGEVARRQNKQVALNLTGIELRLDQEVLDVLAQPVRRLVGFAVAYSIETPAQRQQAGKPQLGQVAVALARYDDRVRLTIQDDGQGIDTETVLRRARQLGWDSINTLPDDQLTELVLSKEFGPIGQANGLDGLNLAELKAQIQAQQGEFSLQNRPGQGLLFTIELPLGMVVVDGMVSRVGPIYYILPVSAVHRIVKPEQNQIVETAADGGYKLLRLEEKLIPIHTLSGGQNGAAAQDDLMLVVEKSDETIALRINELIGQQQVLIRPLKGYLANVPGLSGCALLGDGDVGMVLNLNQI